MNTELSVAISAAVAAAFSAGFAVVSARRTDTLSKRALAESYSESIRQWANETIDVTTTAVRLCRRSAPTEDFTVRRDGVRTLLSAQIEKGRLFFPNTDTELVGDWKEGAYTGLRQRILDVLVGMCHTLDELEWRDREFAHSQLIKGQRAFTSEIQERLDPRTRNSFHGAFR